MALARRSLQHYLDLAGESHVLTESSDADISQAVTEAFEAHKNLEINGGDDVDKDSPVKPCPAQSHVLQATSMITDYHITENNTLTRKIEKLLGTFSRCLHIDATKSMKNTVSTDFYTKTHSTEV